MVWLFFVTWSMIAEGCTSFLTVWISTHLMTLHSIGVPCPLLHIFSQPHQCTHMGSPCKGPGTPPCILLWGPPVLRVYQHRLEGQMRLHGCRYTMMLAHPAQGFRDSFDVGNGHCGLSVHVTILFLLLLCIHVLPAFSYWYFPSLIWMTTWGNHTYPEH